jgi:hypothetical protein
VGATDRPDRAWVRVVDSAGKEHLVRNDSLDQVAVRPSRRQALSARGVQASKLPRRVASPGTDAEYPRSPGRAR